MLYDVSKSYMPNIEICGSLDVAKTVPNVKDQFFNREVLGEADETQKNGKVFKKLDLGNYQWLNYNQVHASTLSFGAGLRSLGIEPKSIIAIYAETRAEWMMSCLGAFSQVSKSKIKH